MTKRLKQPWVFAAKFPSNHREKHFVIQREHWRFLLTWAPGETADFPQWVPWAVLFTTIRRFHDLLDAPIFATYSSDLQAIELNRILSPLIARLTSEGYRTQDFAEPIEGRSPEQLMPRFQHLVSELME